MKKQSGFTLIELMIVVAIIAILAAIALPAYQNYTREARYAELQTTADGLKTAITVCYAKNGKLSSCDTFGELNLTAWAANDNMAAAADGTTIKETTANSVMTITINGTSAAGSKSCVATGKINTTSGSIEWDFSKCNYDDAAAVVAA